MKKVVKFIVTSCLALSLIVLNQVNASAWTSSDHHELITNAANQTNMQEKSKTLMRLASDFADNDKNCAQQRRLHAARNYKVTLAYLTNLAHAYYTNQAHPYAYALDRLSSEGRAQMKDSSEAPSVQECIQNALLPTQLSSQSKNGVTYDESTNAAKAYKIMGFATHVAGDLYAHRTLVPSSTFYAFDKSQFTDSMWTKFTNDVNAGNVEFRDINQYMKDGIQNKNRYYEDARGFLLTRFDQAQVTVNNMVRNFRYYDFDLRWTNYIQGAGEVVLSNWYGYIDN